MIDFLVKSATFDISSQSLSDQARMIYKKCFSHTEILEICGEINHENY